MFVVQRMIKIVTVEQQQNLLHAESKILMPALRSLPVAAAAGWTCLHVRLARCLRE